MKLLLFVAALGGALGDIVSPSTIPGSWGCKALSFMFPTKTFFPGNDVYEYEVRAFWSNTELMNPSCVFRPDSASDVSSLVLFSRTLDSKFAVRGGGHMGIRVRTAVRVKFF
jgi:hypothetical protein